MKTAKRSKRKITQTTQWMQFYALNANKFSNVLNAMSDL